MARESQPGWSLGEDDAPPLLGAYTLEGLVLAVDPVDQRLIPRQPPPLVSKPATVSSMSGYAPRRVAPH